MHDAEWRADLERYFADPSAPQTALQPGARGEQCRNVRLALMRLGFDEKSRYAPAADTFDDAVSLDLKRFQAAKSHTSIDGLCGPGTRKLLVSGLVDELKTPDAVKSLFKRMRDPEHREEGEAFISYARDDRKHVEAYTPLIAEWGYRAWYDREISGGEKFSNTLMQRIAAAYLVLVFVTPRSMKSEWVRKEVEHADKSSVRILAIEVEPVTAHPLSALLSTYHLLGPAPADPRTSAAAPYRSGLKQAFRDAHRQRK